MFNSTPVSFESTNDTANPFPSFSLFDSEDEYKQYVNCFRDFITHINDDLDTPPQPPPPQTNLQSTSHSTMFPLHKKNVLSKSNKKIIFRWLEKNEKNPPRKLREQWAKRFNVPLSTINNLIHNARIRGTYCFYLY